MRRRLVVGLAVVAALIAGPAGPAAAQLGEPLGAVRVLAHRGASSVAPEHTFFAYDLAVEQDTDFLECDLQLTADGVLVCVHDTTVDRTSDGSGSIEEMTLAELRELDWGSWFNTTNPAGADPRYAGAQVVPLEEQLDCYSRLNPTMRYHIETKSPDSLEGAMETELVRVLAERGLVPAETPDTQTDLAIVQSFSRQSLTIMKEIEPRLATALLFAVPDGTNVTPQEAATGTVPDVADAMAPNSAFLLSNPTYVSAVHDNGAEIHTWTVDDPQQMDLLLAMGVDAIFTNVPDVARERVDAAGDGIPAEARGNPATVDPLCPGVAGTVEEDAVAQALRFAGRAFSASGPPTFAGRGEFAYAPDVLLARADAFPDALAAGAAQGLLGAPLLLTGPDALDGRVRAELIRLGAERVHLLGGEAALGEAAEQALGDLGYETSRIGGQDRVETAVALATAAGGDATTAVLARADGPGTAAFADALAAGTAAVALDAPILLTDSSVLSPATAAWLAGSDVDRVVMAGGEVALGSGVETALRDLGVDVVRAGGPTRFDTAIALADLAGLGADGVVLVDGTAPGGWAAGFTAASQAVDAAVAVLPVDGATVPAPIAAFLAGAGPVTCAGDVTAALCDGAGR